MNLKDRALGCILAGGCGDTLGYPVEHKKWIAIMDMYGPSGICNMETKNGVAAITDDTQMTIYTAQGLIHAFQKHCNFDDTVKEVHKSYLRWYISLMHSEETTPCLYASLYPEEELLQNDLLQDAKYNGLDTKMCRGGSTFEALESGTMYTIDDRAPGGVRCGCTMRAAPIAVAFHSNPEEAFKMGCACAALTHGHRSAFLSAGVMCMLIAKLLNGDEAMDAIDSTLTYLSQTPDSESLLRILKNGVDLGKNPRDCAHDDISSIGLGWRADENLAIALYCLVRYKKDIRNALIACVNHDGDSDSVAAVCGNIMGSYAGIENLPKEWLDVLQFRELLELQVNTICSYTEN